MRNWYMGGHLPLYGLTPDWDVRRQAEHGGVTGRRVDELCLTHISGEGGYVRTTSYRADPARGFIGKEAIDDLTRRAVRRLGSGSGSREHPADPVILRSEELDAASWREIQVPIDRQLISVRYAAIGDSWIAIADLDRILLGIEGSGILIHDVRLARVNDLRPYLQILD